MMTKRELTILTLARFPALCVTDLTLFLFPTGSCRRDSAKAQTTRLLAVLRQETIVESRRVNGRHLAYSLTKKGRQVAIDSGESSVLSRPLFDTPSDWAHDRFAASLLAVLSNGNLENYRTEHQLAAVESADRGFPDGLIKVKDRWCLLEIEHTRKTGPHMRRQVNRIEGAVLTGEWWGEIWVNGAVIAYPNNISGINHRTRIVNSLHESALANAGSTIPLLLIGFGVKTGNPSSIQLFNEIDGKLVPNFIQERGLPSRVETGQKIGPRRQFKRFEINLNQLEENSASCVYTLQNVEVSLYADEENRIEGVALHFGEELIARVPIPPTDRETVVGQTLRYLNRLPRDNTGNFLPPRHVSHDVLRDVFSRG